MSEESTANTGETEQPAYVGPIARRRFKRIKLGLLLSSMAACLSVSLLGLACSGIVSLALGITDSGMNYDLLDDSSFLSGLYMGVQLAGANFILFFFTVPAAWLALGLSIGRLPYRGIVDRKPFVKWAIIWGAILVGGTTGGFGLLVSLPYALGALVSGGLIGAIAGAGCGLLFHAIVKPANQIADVDVSVF